MTCEIWKTCEFAGKAFESKHAADIDKTQKKIIGLRNSKLLTKEKQLKDEEARLETLLANDKQAYIMHQAKCQHYNPQLKEKTEHTRLFQGKKEWRNPNEI